MGAKKMLNESERGKIVIAWLRETELGGEKMC